MRAEYKELIGQLQSLKDNSKSFITGRSEDNGSEEIWKADIAALDEAMDIINDYVLMAEQYRGMAEKYETPKEAIAKDLGLYQCPECGKFVNFRNEHCRWCGKRIGWKTHRAAQQPKSGGRWR